MMELQLTHRDLCRSPRTGRGSARGPRARSRTARQGRLRQAGPHQEAGHQALAPRQAPVQQARAGRAPLARALCGNNATDEEKVINYEGEKTCAKISTMLKLTRNINTGELWQAQVDVHRCLQSLYDIQTKYFMGTVVCVRSGGVEQDTFNYLWKSETRHSGSS